MSRNDDDRGAATKVLEVLEALSGYAVKGVSNTALSKQLGMSAPNITRAIGVLIDKGWARKDDATGHFHPTPLMARVFGRVLADLDKAERSLSEIRHNFTRT